MNRLLYAALAASLLGSSAALAQPDPLSDPGPVRQESSNPELPPAANRDLTSQTSHRDDQNDLATGGKEDVSPKANITNPVVTVQNVPALPPAHKTKLMGGDRELTAGILSKDASFRLMVNGPVGVNEIQQLIGQLELEKGILAASDGAPE